MADNNSSTIDNEAVEQIKHIVQLEVEQLNALKQSQRERSEAKAIDKTLREIRKNQDRYGRLNPFTARSWRDFGNRLGNNFRLALTKNILKKQNPGWSDKMASRAAQRLIASGSKGLGAILTKVVPAVGMIVTILDSILKMISERGKYLKSTTMFYPGIQNTGQLFTAATLHAAMLNNPMHTGFFAGNQEFKSAYRSVLEAGTFFKNADFVSGFGTITGGVNSTMSELLYSFKKLAEQGIVLGNSFQETANIMTSVGSQYFMGRGADALNNYKYINSAIKYGLESGFTSNNVTSLLTSYNKNLAYTSNFGFQGALREILTVIRSIGENTEGILDNSNPQQLATQLQSLSSMNVSFAQFIALAKGMRSFGKNDLSNLAESYRTTGQFERLGKIWNTLTSQTGLDIKTLMAVAPGYFGGLQGKSGELLAKVIQKNAATLSGKEFQGLSMAQQLQKLTSEYQLRGLSEQEQNEARYYAQQQVLFEQPLQTIIALLTSAVQSLVQMASTLGFLGNKMPASEIIQESLEQINNINGNRESSKNTWGSRY